MSLLEDFARTCVFMEKTREADGAGGYTVVWAEGAEFSNYQALDTSTEARVAEKLGVAGTYYALVEKSVPIEYNDVFRDTSTGLTYRVTSDPADKEAPASASFSLKYFTAERWELTS